LEIIQRVAAERKRDRIDIKILNALDVKLFSGVEGLGV